MARELVVVLITAPRGGGPEIARRLLEDRLAACVNIIPARSLYWWQGSIEDDQEDLLIVKTKRCLLESLEARVREIHPYTVPEIVAVRPVHVLDTYASWAAEETRECPGGEE